MCVSARACVFVCHSVCVCVCVCMCHSVYVYVCKVSQVKYVQQIQLPLFGMHFLLLYALLFFQAVCRLPLPFSKPIFYSWGLAHWQRLWMVQPTRNAIQMFKCNTNQGRLQYETSWHSWNGLATTWDGNWWRYINLQIQYNNSNQWKRWPCFLLGLGMHILTEKNLKDRPRITWHSVHYIKVHLFPS